VLPDKAMLDGPSQEGLPPIAQKIPPSTKKILSPLHGQEASQNHRIARSLYRSGDGDDEPHGYGKCDGGDAHDDESQ
jgi:hypothetical protein